jgi:hypothetical protein
MSGMSGGGEGPSISMNDCVSCENLVISTLVSSPVKAVLDLITIGAILTVSPASTFGPIDVYYEDKRLGSIITKEEIQLLNCINGGTKYEAKVLTIDGAICRIKIYAVK